ncbi:MAG: hypothetical protein PVSMB10_07240 [Pseudarthrobacter sp.]
MLLWWSRAVSSVFGTLAVLVTFAVTRKLAPKQPWMAVLAAAIAADPDAQAMFDVLTSVNRYALIYRTNSVKQAATRERKIAGFVEMLARGEAPYPQKRKPAAPPK